MDESKHTNSSKVKRNSFTLIEIIVVLSILSTLLAAVATVSFTQLQLFKEKKALEELSYFLLDAADMARLTKTDVAVELHQKKKGLYLQYRSITGVKTSATVKKYVIKLAALQAKEKKQQFTFFHDGFSPLITIGLEGRGQHYQVQFDQTQAKPLRIKKL